MTKQEFKKRLWSWIWRGAMMALVFGVDFLIESLTTASLPKGFVVGAGLLLGEVSKQLHNKYSSK